MNKLTEQQAIIIMGFTGISTINFGKFHEDVEKRLGRPVWTHEFANKEVTQEVKEAYREDFLAICPFEIKENK